MNDWSTVQAWRKATRKDLIAKRLAVPSDERRSTQQKIGDRIRAHFPELNEAVIGFYWPVKGEIDLRPMLHDLLTRGAEAALPVVVEKNRPLEFWEWGVKTKMSRGVGNILIPGNRKPVQPTAILIPLLGFDLCGHRLGFGGGYYDRTLAAFRLKPLTIGVGYAFGRLQTIYPQGHDVALDAIVTETGCMRFDQNRTSGSGVSSPPCYLHEFDGEADLP